MPRSTRPTSHTPTPRGGTLRPSPNRSEGAHPGESPDPCVECGGVLTPADRIIGAMRHALDEIRKHFELDPKGGPWWHAALDVELDHLAHHLEKVLDDVMPNEATA